MRPLIIKSDQEELDLEELKKILEADRAFQLRRSASAATKTSSSTRNSSPTPASTLETPADVLDVSHGVVAATEVEYDIASQGRVSFRPSDFYRNMMYASCSKVASPINEDIECIDISSTEDEESIDDPEEDFGLVGDHHYEDQYGADGSYPIDYEMSIM